jgi:hypothetical protein
MSEEVLRIGLISGITCPDGRQFSELVCHTKDGKNVNVLIPVSGVCELEACDRCSKFDTCEMMIPVDIALGRNIIIQRAD